MALEKGAIIPLGIFLLMTTSYQMVPDCVLGPRIGIMDHGRQNFIL